jgi:hypothetical protein
MHIKLQGEWLKKRVNEEVYLAASCKESLPRRCTIEHLKQLKQRIFLDRFAIDQVYRGHDLSW